MDLTFFKKEGELYKKTTESQVQYIHKMDSVIKHLNEDFDVSVFGSNVKASVKKEDERIHFVAVKR